MDLPETTPEGRYVPRQYRGLLDRLYPFQQRIWESRREFDPRKINIVYTPHGNVGKTTIAQLCRLYLDAIVLPPLSDGASIIQSCCNAAMTRRLRRNVLVFVDLPRAMVKNKLHGLYSAIETIKNGTLYETRYEYREWDIDSPTVWVFTNEQPSYDLLSRDRWRMWTIDQNRELIPFRIPDHESSEESEEELDVPLNERITALRVGE